MYVFLKTLGFSVIWYIYRLQCPVMPKFLILTAQSQISPQHKSTLRVPARALCTFTKVDSEGKCNISICSSPGRSDPATSSRLAEVYAQLEEIEADKAPARYVQIGHNYDPLILKYFTGDYIIPWWDISLLIFHCCP